MPEGSYSGKNFSTESSREDFRPYSPCGPHAALRHLPLCGPAHKNAYGILSDCHVHSCFSDDSEASPCAIAERAIALGLSSICFTDHNDFNYISEDGYAMFNICLPEYIENLKILQEQYIGKIDIHIGIEQGLMKSEAGRINAFDKERELDFIIGSSHLVNGADPYYPAFWDEKGVSCSIRAYYESILENLEACDNFDVYGHLDYIIRYIPKERVAEYSEADYHELIDAILRSVTERGKGIEINTAGFRYGFGGPNPSEFVIKRYRELGGEIITAGSDAHSPEHVAYGFGMASSILKAAGFRYCTRFVKRSPEFIRLF